MVLFLNVVGAALLVGGTLWVMLTVVAADRRAAGADRALAFPKPDPEAAADLPRAA